MKKVKVAICQHCEAVVILASMPEAETDRDTRRDFVKAAKQGLIIDMLSDEEWKAKPFGHRPECKFYRRK